ncbi:MAG TPA: TetR/AcrR family transcriptional regulator [Pseudonocardiaceae bacterium]|nr:TetR/AcrR family transcriptional regulator [Pseudonocardiaceae bacterium]
MAELRTEPNDPSAAVLERARARYSPAARKVVDAGVDLFAQVGFLATTIRDLTRSCGITAPSFYNHFESKEALLYDIVRTANSALEQRLDALEVDTLDPVDALSGLVYGLVTFNLTHPKEARIANREWVFLQPAMRDEVSTHRRRVRSLFEQVLASADTQSGLLDGAHEAVPDELEIRLLAMSILNLGIASSDWYRSDRPLTIPEVGNAYCRLALRMAGLAPPAAPRTPSPRKNSRPRT